MRYAGFNLGREMFRASRFAYFFQTGIDPVDKLICHRCDNPLCVNPGHLFEGTPLDNQRDCAAKGRKNSPAGEAAHAAILTEENVLEIRSSQRTRSNYQSLADKFGVCEGSIQAVVYRRTWKHIH